MLLLLVATKLTEQAVEEFLGIQINNYVVIDFRGFKDLVDAIGGIDIDVEKDMYYEDPMIIWLLTCKKVGSIWMVKLLSNMFATGRGGYR